MLFLAIINFSSIDKGIKREKGKCVLCRTYNSHYANIMGESFQGKLKTVLSVVSMTSGCSLGLKLDLQVID